MITIQDLFWLIPSASVLALIFAAVFFYRMKAQDEGNEVMKMIAKHVRSGAMPICGSNTRPSRSSLC